MKANQVEAGRPFFYLFEQGDDIENPRFEDVILRAPHAMSAEVMYDGDWGEGYGSVELRSTYEPFAVAEDMRQQVFSLMDGDINMNTEMVDGFSTYFLIPQLYDQDENRIVRNLTLNFRQNGETIITVSKKVAHSWDGNGSETKPYLIKSSDQLVEVSEAFNSEEAAVLNKYFRQTVNIEFDKTVKNNFTPVKNFYGYYDGDGYTISGLNIDKPTYNVALIQNLLSGSVKNVIIRNSYIHGYLTGAIAASVTGAATVENCHVLKDVTLEPTFDGGGGIVGLLNAEKATVTSCTSQAVIKGTDVIGGVIGTVTAGTVSNCMYLGNSLTSEAEKLNAVIGKYNDFYVTNKENLFFTCTTLADPNAALMPDMMADNTTFLTQLAERDEFLLKNSSMTKEQIGYDITLNGRTMKAAKKADGTWQSLALSICPPFNLDLSKLANAGDFKVYKLHEVDLDKKVMQFTNEFPLLEAGVPYMVVINKGEIPLSAQNTTIIASPKEPIAINTTDGSKQVGWWVGTFKRIENDRFFTDNIYIAQRNKTFKCPPAGYTKAFIYPFVGYFSAVEPQTFQTFQTKYIYTENGEEQGEETDFPAEEFVCDIDLDDAPTGIQTVNKDGSMSNAQRSTYYDLQGRKLSSKPAKGVYIQHGQKVVVK